MNKTLYKRLEDICAREYIINKLSANSLEHLSTFFMMT